MSPLTAQRTSRRWLSISGALLLSLTSACVTVGTAPAGSTPQPTAAPERTLATDAAALLPPVLPEPSSAPEPPAEPWTTPVPPPSAVASPTQSTFQPVPGLDPPAAAGPFAINLFQDGDFVGQATDYWCVAAAMQTMMNIMGDDGESDTSRRTQRDLYFLGRELSTPQLESIGIEPEGWSNGLNERGFGPYVVHIEESLKGAIHVAAEALRLTGKPVGLVTWRGAHSWVMSGFQASADPAYSEDFTVEAVWVQDVWYPRVSSIWGSSPEPNTLWPVDRLKEDYRAFFRPNRVYPDRDGKYVLILPL